MTGSRVHDAAHHPAVSQVDAEITELLAGLGVDCAAVAAALGAARVVGVRGISQADPICLYLQQRMDPLEREVRILECDVDSLAFAVINPDGETWTHAATSLPWPVLLFCCRADTGEFGHLFAGGGPP